jgi:hypothetical protein
MNYRKAYDRPIDDAHSRIAGAEMMLEHSFTDEDRTLALDQLAAAQRYLARAVEAKWAWLAVEHDDYEEFPEVPFETQFALTV